MKSLYRAAVALAVLLCAACGGGQQPSSAPAGTAAPAAVSGPAPQPYGSLAQVMRSIPFPNSNIIFDTQTNDPGAQKRPEGAGKTGAGATSTYSGVYTGWQQVEQAAVAISETANLVMIPGRLCENGKPVPLDRDDFKKAAQGLADAGKAALKAAQSKNLDAMVEVSGTISDACLACHEKYRDMPDGKVRCVPLELQK
jgi:hypothetical protein